MESLLQQEEYTPEPQPEWPNPGPGRIKRFAKYFYNRFLRLRGSPEQIAWGAAVGFFLAMSPTMGFQIAIAIPVAAFFRINKVVAATTVWLTNPFTAPFIYGINYMIGAKLLGCFGYGPNGAFLSNPSWHTFWYSGKHVFAALVVGGIPTGVVVAVAGYFLTLVLVRTAREKTQFLRRKKNQ